MTKEDLGGIRKAAQWCQTHAASSSTLKQLVGDVFALLTEVERLQQRDARAQVTMHCPRCEEWSGQLAEALALVEAQARAEERYVAQLLEGERVRYPAMAYVGCSQDHVRWTSVCVDKKRRGQHAATCWRIWARAEEAAK